nr:hypothetical protein [Tanacetum cinerariifolium]
SPFILGRPFLWTARALIDVHEEEMILCDGDERLTLNMRCDTSSYLNQPQKDSINMINIYDDSCEDYLEDLFATNHLSGNLTFSSHPDLTSPEVINPLSGSTTSSSLDNLLEEFADELAFITFPCLTMILPRKWILFSRIRLMSVDALPSTNNEDKVFNTGIFIHENLSEVIVQIAPDKNVNNMSISHASLILDDFDPLLCELPFHKEVLGSETLLSFSFENKKKVFKPRILTSKGVYTFLLSELSHRGPKAFKVIKIFESPMKIFLALMERTFAFWMFRVSISIPHEQTKFEGWVKLSDLKQALRGISWILKTRARGFVLRSLDLHILSFILGIQYPNLIV